MLSPCLETDAQPPFLFSFIPGFQPRAQHCPHWGGASHLRESLTDMPRGCSFCLQVLLADKSAVNVIVFNFIWVIMRDFPNPCLSSSSALPGLPGLPPYDSFSLVIFHPSHFFGIYPLQDCVFFRDNCSLHLGHKSVFFISKSTLLFSDCHYPSFIFHFPTRQVQMYSLKLVGEYGGVEVYCFLCVEQCC